MSVPDSLPSVEALDEWMTTPSAALVDAIRSVSNPLVVLGAGGKMGPSLCVRARRAADLAGHPLTIVAVSRFRDPLVRTYLEDAGVRTLSVDLLADDAEEHLPEARHVVFLVGQKFGTSDRPELTWAVNTVVPSLACRRYSGARIVALSTGNVYPLTTVDSGGSMETDPPGPVGEYANACLARERLFSYHAAKDSTPVLVVRLNYAVDLRYGVLVDIAQRVDSGAPVGLDMGYLNCIWQGDANDVILRSFDLAEPHAPALNLTGPEILSVRSLAERLGRLLDKQPRFSGSEKPTALLSNAARCVEHFGPPQTPVDRVLEWTADWIRHDRPVWNKPTHFEQRDGAF